MARPLQITTFNVNGIRSIRDYYAQSKLNGNLTFSQFLDSFNSDILCFQEHKTNESIKLSQGLSFPSGYLAFYVFPKQPRKIGYSGVATFVRETSPWRPIAWYDGFSGVNDGKLLESPLLRAHFSTSELVELDSEARCVITDHLHFFVINCYFPNDSGEHRNEFRHRFYYAIQLRCLDLIRQHGKAIILVGDINIAYHPLDHCEYAATFKKEFPTGAFDVALHLSQTDSQLVSDFYSNPMRRWLAEWLYLHKCNGVDFEIDSSLVWRDCFRALKPFAEFHDQYTCWNTLIGARGSNYGTRIDAIFTCGPLFAEDCGLVKLEDCSILSKVMGSDHCPVFCKFVFDEALLEVNDEELKRMQLKKGNISRSFGRMDEFFAKKRKDDPMTEEKKHEDASEKTAVVNATGVSPAVVKPERQSLTILSFFGKKPKLDSAACEEDKEAAATTLSDDDCSGESTLMLQEFSEAAAYNASSAKDQWSAFFSKQPPPRCHHNIDCVLRKVKKSGPNRGRSFYCCSKPVGPAGNPESRCDFFQWLNPTSK